MAIGRTFEEAFQKSLRMLDIGADGFDAGKYAASDKDIVCILEKPINCVVMILFSGNSIRSSFLNFSVGPR